MGKKRRSTVSRASQTYSGKGGYSTGILNTPNPLDLYVYVGGIGQSSITGEAQGGFNGGGNGYASGDSEPGNGGGGATDIRIEIDSLYARLIVAGGGGGGGGYFGGGGITQSKVGADCYGAGGGSGFVWNKTNFEAGYTNDSITGGKWLLSNYYYLTNGVTIGGNNEMPNYIDNSIMVGNSNNGYARITPLIIKNN